jgi:formate dehydrogenase maturation protein FdhE
MEEKDINRLILQFEQLLRESNREHINARIEELNIDGLKPLVDLVARSRATYLEHLYKLCQKYEDSENFPDKEELQRLRAYRNRFIELADGAKSFEISIQRGYVDLKLDQD